MHLTQTRFSQSTRTDPSLERFLDWLDGHGITMRVASDAVPGGDFDPVIPDARWDETRRTWSMGPAGDLHEARDPARGLHADHATRRVFDALVRTDAVDETDVFWEVGCGTGVLSAWAASRGASVVASDLDEEVLDLARETCGAHRSCVTFLHGSLLEPFEVAPAPSVVVANIPHKPALPGDVLPMSQHGGEDGLDWHPQLAEGLGARLAPGGRVFAFLHSLPHPRIFEAWSRHFEITMISFGRRYFAPGEYGALQDRFVARSHAGTSLVFEEGDRRYLFAGTYLMKRRGLQG